MCLCLPGCAACTAIIMNTIFCYYICKAVHGMWTRRSWEELFSLFLVISPLSQGFTAEFSTVRYFLREQELKDKKKLGDMRSEGVVRIISAAKVRNMRNSGAETCAQINGTIHHFCFLLLSYTGPYFRNSVDEKSIQTLLECVEPVFSWSPNTFRLYLDYTLNNRRAIKTS